MAKNKFDKNMGVIHMCDVERMLFEGRVIFPVVDHNGLIVGAVGRSLKLQPKYKVVGNGFVGNVLTEASVIILTEGIVDVLLAQLQGADNVLGVVGAEVTEDAIRAFAARKKKIALFFDQDKYGKASAAKLAKRMELAGLAVDVFETDTAIDMQQYLLQGNAVASIVNCV